MYKRQQEEILTGRIKATDAQIAALPAIPREERPAILEELRDVYKRQPLLEVKDLQVTVGEEQKILLNGLNLTVCPGETPVSYTHLPEAL